MEPFSAKSLSAKRTATSDAASITYELRTGGDDTAAAGGGAGGAAATGLSRKPTGEEAALVRASHPRGLTMCMRSLSLLKVLEPLILRSGP